MVKDLDVMIKNSYGITLLEVMLVLAIASTIVLSGIRQYTFYQRDRNAFVLKYNIDILFQGMRNYYYANCAESTDTNMALHKLAPSRNPSNPFAVTIQTMLGNYLDTTWHPFNPLIDSSFGDSGYDVQFNQISWSGARNENFCYYYPGTSQTNPTCGALVNSNAIVYSWIAQIVVKIQDPNMTLALKGMTGANCALTDYTSPTIVDCSTGATSGAPSYLVWQRLPSFASPDTSSGLWRAAPTVKAFKLQYTNDTYWELVNAPNGVQGYYLCGG